MVFNDHSANFGLKHMIITHSEMKELGCGLPCQMHVKKPNISVLLKAWL